MGVNEWEWKWREDLWSISFPQRNERSLYHIINDVVRVNISNHGEKEIDHRSSQLCYLRIFGVNKKCLLSDGQSVCIVIFNVIMITIHLDDRIRHLNVQSKASTTHNLPSYITSRLQYVHIGLISRKQKEQPTTTAFNQKENIQRVFTHSEHNTCTLQGPRPQKTEEAPQTQILR